MIRQPPTLNIPIFNVAETINRASLDAIARGTGSYGYLPFTGFDASLTRMNFSKLVAYSRAVDVLDDITPPPPPSSTCDSELTPGILSLVATKDAPSNPVVVGQDPSRGGVDLTWTLNILPTVYTYGLWELIPYEYQRPCKSVNSECQINQSGLPCCLSLKCEQRGDQPSGNGICVRDYYNYPDRYACVDNTLTYQEDIATLTPKAILDTPSRNWILGPLGIAYPGAHLIHPDWGFRATEPCIWQSDHTCLWTHTEGHVQVADPGWYDLVITGTTAGTEITPPRDFILIGGRFGVYLVESTITRQP
jgi:hypothetical protein